jgi:RecA/RadA recombinase
MVSRYTEYFPIYWKDETQHYETSTSWVRSQKAQFSTNGGSMGYFKELEIEVIDLVAAEVPVEEVAEMVGVSTELVTRIKEKWERSQYTQSIKDYA